MAKIKHIAILINNTSKTQKLVQQFLKNHPVPGCETLYHKKGMLFARSEIERFMDEEERHDIKILTQHMRQPLKTMSSGEQKKALLKYLMRQDPNFLVLINPFDNLDAESQSSFRRELNNISKSKTLVQVVSRLDDILPMTTDFFKLDGSDLISYPSPESFWKENRHDSIAFSGSIPPPMKRANPTQPELVSFNNVSVSFDGRKVLDGITWTIKQGEFWQLMGPNGSGKTTLLSMITGDSHKGYGQDLTLFGRKKGSGESVWDLKEKIGYFTPAMMDKFRGYHTLENMIISGLHDSIGLYIQPTDVEKKLARQWLNLLQLTNRKDDLFKSLTSGEKRLVMTARAMIKHPPLLILDEPTAGLDDTSATFFIALVNKIANESDTAIVYVSHRNETGLNPQYNYILDMKETGSAGKVEILENC
ncbi:ATP-binding cassette domain-containing protein [Muricauda sp. JGD-17]|uniref:ATP-binding cassette domain-containing protein n=1 Tax=Flagellimonas ochracea TaxID=2696472 RepID=A0A964WYD3_9FLAO|nr:ATP-binding cassette domain-containing protein [Allomuricauda ochracea]NAY93055.1 ATP-binding cassette domain-containing protein [Allomuricauda ochracea]